MATLATDPPAPATDGAPAKASPASRLPILGLVIVLLAAFMDMLDNSIVAIAIPSVQRDLGASYTQIQWVAGAYTLAFALGLITAGRLGDILGYKRMFIIGVVGFAATSALCGFARSPEMLIGARVMQGITAATMIPQVVALIRVIFPPKQQGMAMAGYGITAGLANVVGPIAGGLLVQADLFDASWRPIFLINVPIGLLTLLTAAMFLPNAKSRHHSKLDVAGAGLVVLATLMLFYPLVQGRDLGWPAWTFASMAGSVVVFALFVWHQRGRTARGKSPLIALSVFKNRSFSAGMLLILSYFGALLMFFLAFYIYLQVGLGYSPVRAGLIGLAMPFGMMITSGIGAGLAPRLGGRVTVIGLVIVVLGFGAVLWGMHLADGDVTAWHLIPGLLISGLGGGFVIPPLGELVLVSVNERDAGSASGLFTSFIQLGITVGAALVGVVFFNAIGAHADTSIDTVAPRLERQLVAAQVPGPAREAIVTGVRECFTDRMQAKDPNAVPASCQVATGQGAQLPESARHAITKAVNDARQDNFTHAMYRAGAWGIVAYLVAMACGALLPRQGPKHQE